MPKVFLSYSGKSGNWVQQFKKLAKRFFPDQPPERCFLLGDYQNSAELSIDSVVRMSIDGVNSSFAVLAFLSRHYVGGDLTRAELDAALNQLIAGSVVFAPIIMDQEGFDYWVAIGNRQEYGSLVREHKYIDFRNYHGKPKRLFLYDRDGEAIVDTDAEDQISSLADFIISKAVIENNKEELDPAHGRDPLFVIIDETSSGQGTASTFDYPDYRAIARRIVGFAGIEVADDRIEKVSKSNFRDFVKGSSEKVFAVFVPDSSCKAKQEFESFVRVWMDEVDLLSEEEDLDLEIEWIAIVSKLGREYERPSWKKKTLEPVRMVKLDRDPLSGEWKLEESSRVRVAAKLKQFAAGGAG